MKKIFYLGIILTIIILMTLTIFLITENNKKKDYFQYTHIYGQNYSFFVQGYKYPLDDDAKCSLLNEALKLAPDNWTCNCERLKLHESNWYLDCGIGCVGFNIDEDNKKITSITTCTTN